MREKKGQSAEWFGFGNPSQKSSERQEKQTQREGTHLGLQNVSFITSLLYAYSSLFRDNREVTYD